MKIKRFYCTKEDCNKSFRSEEQLIGHINLHSAQEECVEDQFLFECDICKVHFPTKRSVSAHKRVHKSSEKQVGTQHIINELTQRLIINQKNELESQTSRFTLEELKLPPITGPVLTTLPLFSSISNNQF